MYSEKACLMCEVYFSFAVELYEANGSLSANSYYYSL